LLHYPILLLRLPLAPGNSAKSKFDIFIGAAEISGGNIGGASTIGGGIIGTFGGSCGIGGCCSIDGVKEAGGNGIGICGAGAGAGAGACGVISIEIGANCCD
jgi:hypothetical protein